MVFMVGIDAAGGDNPWADGVQWAPGAHVYNDFHALPSLTVEVEQPGYVTIFLRSITRWFYENANGYWGNASLTFGEAETECEGLPRIQYERTYVLLPPGTTLANKHRVLDRYPDKTMGPSADDAGATDLDDKTVIAINPDEWQDDLQSFFTTWYPDVKYEEVFLDPPEQELVLRNPSSHDPAYITSKFGEQRPGYVHNGIDLRASWAVWGDTVLAAYAGEVIASENVGDGFGVHVRTVTVLPDGSEMLLRYAHLVDGQRVRVGDVLKAGDVVGMPGSTGNSTGDHLHFDVKINGVYVDPEPLIAWTVEPPAPQPRVTRGHIGLHLQTMVSGWEQFYRDVKPPLGKVLKSMQDVYGLKRASINTTAIWRRVDDDQGPYLEAADPMQGARAWIDTFRDSLYEVCNGLAQEFPHLKAPYFYVESLNETYCSLDVPSITRARNFDMAFIPALAECNLPIALAVFCGAVGNPHETEFELLVPLARLCQQAGGLMGYHNYWWVQNEVSTLQSEWRYFAGRWAAMDEVFVANGVHVNWFGGESGAYESVEMGWRNPKCFNGDWAAYLQDIKDIDQYLAEWNVIHGDRFLGLVLFTSGLGTGWPWFQIRDLEIADLQTFLLQRYS